MCKWSGLSFEKLRFFVEALAVQALYLKSLKITLDEYVNTTRTGYFYLIFLSNHKLCAARFKFNFTHRTEDISFHSESKIKAKVWDIVIQYPLKQIAQKQGNKFLNIPT